MKKKFLPLIFVLGTIISCNGPAKQNNMKDNSPDIKKLLDTYYEERLPLFPLEATAIADNRYNDKLPCDISDSYREKLKSFYKEYLDKISAVKRENLKGEEALSYDVFKREMEIQIEGLSFHDNLIPFNQFWGMHLTFAQLGSGESNQPFKTVKDYNDFLGRIHGFVIWCDTAVVNMKRGMEQKFVLPQVLAKKILPQLQAMLVTDVTQSVFYGPIKKLPESFSVEDKKKFTDAYTTAI